MAVGRPRAFDKHKVLDRALQVFLQKGYEGASLSELTDAMGINPPSLYAAFGNKEGLFRAALDRYACGQQSMIDDAMAAPTAQESIERFLRGTILSQTRKNASGCLVVHGLLSCSDAADPIRREVTERKQQGEDLLRARLLRGIDEGDLPADTDADALARYVVTVLQGTAVQAASGATHDELDELVQMTMRAFPPAPARSKKKR